VGQGAEPAHVLNHPLTNDRYLLLLIHAPGATTQIEAS
jgi:hypothetical protein